MNKPAQNLIKMLQNVQNPFSFSIYSGPVANNANPSQNCEIQKDNMSISETLKRLKEHFFVGL